MADILGKVAIIDDEAAIRFTLHKALTSYEVTGFENAEEALEYFKTENDFDLVITDYKLPGISGLEFLTELKELLPSYKAILITAYPNEGLLNTLVNEKLVYKILNKPVKMNKVKAVVSSALEELRSERDEQAELTELQSELAKYKAFSSAKSYGKHSLVYASEIMKELEAEAVKQASANANILITGESGTGKEVFAQLMHQESQRSDNPIINLNCSTIPEHLFESEMFGHTKGSFTTALSDKPGKFQLANGGTLFLDEISELPLQQQAKLLRVLTDKEVTPVGATTPVSVDVRLICASNRDLHEMADRGLFRKDLLYRINTLELDIPPLRERKEDISDLVSFFLYKISNDEGAATKEITREALDHFNTLEYRDNNIRELQNMIFKLIITVDHDFITLDDVKAVTKVRRNKKTADEVLDLDDTVSITEFKQIAETAYLRAQLEKFDFHVTNTADALGIHVSNLSRKLKKFNISLQGS